MIEKPTKARPRLFLIDGYALIYRAFFAMLQHPLTTSRGENTSAAYGFTRFLLKILEEHAPDYLGVVLDAGTSARELYYPAYKATREKMPDELRSSLPRIRELLAAFKVPVLELANHEADDVIGTLAVRAAAQELEAVIVSGDKDFYQLVRPGICLLNPGRGGSAGVEEEWVDIRNASERLGVAPTRVVDYLGLIGDSSDNVPGAKGIGPKTAIKLIDTYGPLEEILAHVDDISNKRARAALIEHRDDIILSKRLVTIQVDLPIELDLEALRVADPDRDKLREVFLALEFHSMVREYAAPEEATARIEQDYQLVDTAAEVEALVGRARQLGRLALGVQATRADPVRAELVGISLCLDEGEAYYLPFGHRSTRAGELPVEDEPIRNLPALSSAPMRPLVALVEDMQVAKVGHNLKYDLLVLRRAGLQLRGLAFDTMIASYLLAPGRREHGLDSLALQRLGQRTTTYDELCGKGSSRVPLEECALEAVTQYACGEADSAFRLVQLFEGELERYELADLFVDIEMPLLCVLADMEWCGIRVEPGFFAQLSNKLARELMLLRDDIYKESGGEFNINSTPQLRQVLFDKLELPVLKRTKTGPSTDASVLEDLASQGHALPKLLTEYRQLDKLKSTYVDALPQLINPETKRIHTSFNQTVAATGRLSSSDPNLQNIPIRTEVGAEIRKGFIPADDHLFLAADYSQIELRILAHLSEDPAFIEAFRRGTDIHRQTAALVFDVQSQDVTAHMRDAAKTINFATIYGIGPFALARRLGTSVAEAKQFIQQYFLRFPGVRRYLDEQIEKARSLGYVETLSGRRRYIPEIHSRNYNVRQFGERAATNAPVQGSAADIIKLAMIAIARQLNERGSGARMLLQVHDELVFEVPRPEIESVRALATTLMENAFALKVPLEVATGVGTSWLECK